MITMPVLLLLIRNRHPDPDLRALLGVMIHFTVNILGVEQGEGEAEAADPGDIGEAGGGGAKRGHSKPAKVGQFVLFISIRLFSLQSFVLNTYRYLSLTVVACLCFQCCGT